MIELSLSASLVVYKPDFPVLERTLLALQRAAKDARNHYAMHFELTLVDNSCDLAWHERLQVWVKEHSDEWADWTMRVLQLNENQGAASARNSGWASANQPYIAFLDADDAWHPRKIEIQYAYMSKHPEAALCGHGHRVVRRTAVMPDWDVSSEEVRPVYKWELLLSNKFVTPAAMLRCDARQRFIPGQRYMEDHMLWLNLVCEGGKIVKLAAELAAIYKSPFGAAGLSAQLWPMEKCELGNYARLHNGGCINLVQWLGLVSYSMLKYVRRLVMYWGYLRWSK